ncbi:MAG TPA: hypothetical protein VGH80_12320 [Xanthomonadaceae bacterium]|jgi:hypothetical protein
MPKKARHAHREERAGAACLAMRYILAEIFSRTVKEIPGSMLSSTGNAGSGDWHDACSTDFVAEF